MDTRGNSDPATFFGKRRLFMGASALLLRDKHRQIVIVKPHYKPVWHLPGGLMEADESPRVAAERETFEEIGLRVRAKQLLVVDYDAHPAQARRAAGTR